MEMSAFKKLVELEKLLKKSEKLSSKLLELNNDVDENELTNLTIDSKTLKNDIKIINKITKEFKETHKKISKITSTFTDEDKEEIPFSNESIPVLKSLL